MHQLLSDAERLHALLMRNQVVRQIDDVTGTGSAVSQCLYGVRYQIIVVTNNSHFNRKVLFH